MTADGDKINKNPICFAGEESLLRVSGKRFTGGAAVGQQTAELRG